MDIMNTIVKRIGIPRCVLAWKPRMLFNPVRGLTMGELYQETIDKQQYLNTIRYTYIWQWKKDFDADVAKNEELKKIKCNPTCP